MAITAPDLANAFKSLSELEFFEPESDSFTQRQQIRQSIKEVQSLAPEAFHAYAIELVQFSSVLCLGPSHNPEALFRAFDWLDEVLEINYATDFRMPQNSLGPERIYESAGAAVQTSYLTIFRILDHLKLHQGAHLIDLGSGYGRVGLTAGLWREDLRFTGFELIGHRIVASRDSAERAGLTERIQFFEQNLSALDFVIPSADAYFLYDPFTESTYQHVFAQLVEIAKERPVTIIAKDGARGAVQRHLNLDHWSKPESIDDGFINLFHSRY